jgi:hypothetical protein
MKTTKKKLQEDMDRVYKMRDNEIRSRHEFQKNCVSYRAALDNANASLLNAATEIERLESRCREMSGIIRAIDLLDRISSHRDNVCPSSPKSLPEALREQARFDPIPSGCTGISSLD